MPATRPLPDPLRDRVFRGTDAVRLQAAGWTVVFVTAADLPRPTRLLVPRPATFAPEVPGSPCRGEPFRAEVPG